jgi:hypothetical protein
MLRTHSQENFPRRRAYMSADQRQAVIALWLALRNQRARARQIIANAATYV